MYWSYIVLYFLYLCNNSELYHIILHMYVYCKAAHIHIHVLCHNMHVLVAMICDRILEKDQKVMHEINRIYLHVLVFVILTSTQLLSKYFQCLNGN